MSLEKPFSTEFDRFHNSLVNLGKSKNTVSQYETRIQQFLDFYREKNKALGQFDLSDLDAFINNRREREEQRRKSGQPNQGRLTDEPGTFSTSTLAAYRIPLIKFFKVNGFLKIANSIELPRVRHKPRKVLMESEIVKTLSLQKIKDKYHEEIEAGQNEDFYVWRAWALLNFLFSTGARISEVQKLKTEDLKLELRIPVAFFSSKGGERTVPLSTKWLEIYDIYKKYRRADSDYVFTTKSGARMATGSLQNIVKFFTGFSPHKFRHTYAVLMLDESKDPKLVQERLGHASLATTDTYLKLVKIRKDDAMNPLDSLGKREESK